MLASSHPTGLWLEEFAVPYTAFSEAGASIRVVSPQGGVVPIDPKTAPTEKDHEKWPDALDALNFTERLAEVSANSFDAIFIPGGHGPMVDLAHDSSLHQLLADFDREGKLIAAICHGSPRWWMCAIRPANRWSRAGKSRVSPMLKSDWSCSMVWCPSCSKTP